MQADTLIDIAEIEAHAWRITFQNALAKGQEPLLILNEPINLFAVAESVSFSNALAKADDADHRIAKMRGKWTSANGVKKEHTDGPLLLLCLPLGASLAYDIESRFEAWLNEGRDKSTPPIRAGLRTSRVLWSEDRAIIYALPEQMCDTIDAVVRFTVMARQTMHLENEMAALWPALAVHIPLIHAVTRRQQRLQPTVNKMTERTGAMMTTLLRLEVSLEQLDPVLVTGSKRLCAELIQQAALYDRLEALEDPIEHAGDIYELANSRLTEARFAIQNNSLEKLIVVLLALELAIMGYPLLAPTIIARLWGF